MKRRNNGFLLLEILISALIIAGSISASFYLFRMGLEYWQKAEDNNKLISKVPHAVSYLNNVAPLERGEGEALLGDNIRMKWRARLLTTAKPQKLFTESGLLFPYELYLYEVVFILQGTKSFREYNLKVFRYKMLFTPDLDKT